jgi:hypothetical protein
MGARKFPSFASRIHLSEPFQIICAILLFGEVMTLGAWLALLRWADLQDPRVGKAVDLAALAAVGFACAIFGALVTAAATSAYPDTDQLGMDEGDANEQRTEQKPKIIRPR